ncbi:hypothetical protein M0802_000236 [Mischocyttarus mexicanus]|nr:hypothetical protein M0802_000236 [Mischocyttarus mexicanus]
MSSFLRFQKWTILSLGALGGTALFYYNKYSDCDSSYVLNSWTTNFTPSVKWDTNWDKRDPKSLVKPVKIISEIDENKYNEEFAAKRSKHIRHLVLIRHGQYNTAGKGDSEKVLTELVRSTLTRAQETSKIIEMSLPNVPTQDDSLLAEGAPIPPEPPIGNWMSLRHFYQDGPRIEAAFRKYFHRADPQQQQDTVTILVCHANVIRYFVCRALQFPPEAWMRMSLNHGSITWLMIYPNGRVTMVCFGDTGHMPPKTITVS